MVANEQSEVRREAAGGGGGVQGDGLKAIGPQGQPLILNHFLQEYLLGAGGGLKFVVKVGEEQVEFLAFFVRDEEDGAGEAVGKTIGAGPGFPFRCPGACRLLRISAVGFNLCECGHVGTILLWRVLAG